MKTSLGALTRAEFYAVRGPRAPLQDRSPGSPGPGARPVNGRTVDSVSISAWVLLGLATISLVYWVITLILILRVIRRVPVLKNGESPRRDRWPMLSLMIPACNEADHIEEALRARLSEDYPNLEVIVVEDRSTD